MASGSSMMAFYQSSHPSCSFTVDQSSAESPSVLFESASASSSSVSSPSSSSSSSPSPSSQPSSLQPPPQSPQHHEQHNEQQHHEKPKVSPEELARLTREAEEASRVFQESKLKLKDHHSKYDNVYETERELKVEIKTRKRNYLDIVNQFPDNYVYADEHHKTTRVVTVQRNTQCTLTEVEHCLTTVLTSHAIVGDQQERIKIDMSKALIEMFTARTSVSVRTTEVKEKKKEKKEKKARHQGNNGYDRFDRFARSAKRMREMPPSDSASTPDVQAQAHDSATTYKSRASSWKYHANKKRYGRR